MFIWQIVAYFRQIVMHFYCFWNKKRVGTEIAIHKANLKKKAGSETTELLTI